MVNRQSVLTKIFGDPQKRVLKGLEKKVNAINALAEKYHAMSKPELRKQTDELKKRLAKKGTKLDDILPDAFALVREASDRVLGMRHFDVQLIGGMVLNDGNVAELKTGEGKTLMATLPVYLNALEGKGVHVVTVNDYLAQRDAGWNGELYDFLGLSTGVIINDASFIYDKDYDNEAHDDPRMRKLRPATRKEAYAADVTYGTNNEFGFDYLRDNMVNEVDELRQRELHFAIVDEVDSILIDEARTPLIISAPAAENPDSYYQFAKIAAKLTSDDYVLDEKRRTVALSDSGVDKVQKMLGIKNLYSPDYIRSVYHMDQALKAQTIFKRDKDYVVTNDGEVIIVDEHTGRLMQGRRYNEGLHQAIEAKENVPVQQESMTLATVSFQNFFRLYKKLAGMTGTAFTEAEEFQQIYELDVIQVPPNRPITRIDHEDLIFKTEAGKLKAVADAIKEYHKVGRPVLVGSASIAKNELIANYLKKEGIKYEILNAKNNEREASIVEKAGEKGAITLATNIAGRGTDIKLGEGVKDLGGLVVIGSERHESRRIDNQLRGRGGRQGDPGDTQFYVSTEDDLMRIFQGERIASLMNRLGVDEDTPIQNKAVSKTLESAQKRVEGYNYDMRKNVVQYDNVINRHRRVVYVMRRKILEGETIKPEIERLIADKVAELTTTPAKNNPKFIDEFGAAFPIDDSEIAKIGAEKRDKTRTEKARKAVEKLYADKEKELTPETMRKVERDVYIQVLDTLWMQHLENMQHLREGIHWRSVGQRDPLVEYRSESSKLFDSLQATLRDEVLGAIMHVRPNDITATAEEDHETELTRLAESSVERGVNEITSGSQNRDGDFSVEKKQKTEGKIKNDARKKKKGTKAEPEEKSQMRHIVEEVKLKNGARGLLIDVPGATVMSFQFQFRAGNRYVASKDIYETAHIMEHMAFGANARFKDEHQFEAEFTKNGAYHNAYTSDLSMVYVADCADFEWERILDLQRVSICQPRFNNEELDAEKGNVRGELTGHLNSHNRLLWPKVQQLLGEDVLTYNQRLKTIPTVKLKDIKEHHARTHTAGNLRFVIAGRLNGRKSEIKRQLEEWELAPGERFEAPHDEFVSGNPTLIRRKEASNLTFAWSMIVPRELTDEESDAMNCLDHILTGTMHSRIYGAARKKGLAYDMFSDTSVGFHDSSWDFGGQVNVDRADALFDIIVRELRTVLDGKITEAEIDAAKSYALGRHQMGAQTVSQISNFYTSRYFADGVVKDYEKVPDSIKGTSRECMIETAREFIKQDINVLAGVSSGERSELVTLNDKLSVLFEKA